MATGKTKSGLNSDRIPTVPVAKLAMPNSRTSGKGPSPLMPKICSAVNRGLEILPQAREREADAGSPEDEPLADERHDGRGAVKERMLDHDRADRQGEHGQKNDGQIHRRPAASLPRI